MVEESIAYAYAKWCVDEAGEYAPSYVKKQAKAWIDIADGKDEEAYVDEEEYERVYRKADW